MIESSVRATSILSEYSVLIVRLSPDMIRRQVDSSRRLGAFCRSAGTQVTHKMLLLLVIKLWRASNAVSPVLTGEVTYTTLRQMRSRFSD